MQTAPKDATSGDVLKAALAATPDLGVDDTEVLAPTPADQQSAPLEYEFEEGDEADAVVSNRTDGAPAVAPPAKSTAGATGEQPVDVSATATPTTQAPPPAQETQTAPDIWAETEELTYTDGDTGESYVVRAPKSYADKVKNGYARRSIMDRNSGYLSKHRQWLEPIISNKQMDDIAPVIQRSLEDREFAEYVAQAYERRRLGLPLVAAQQQAIAQSQAPAAAPAQTPQGVAELRQQVLARLSPDEVDDYSRDTILKAFEPMLEVLARQQERENTFERQQREQQERQQAAERQRQQNIALGQRTRNLLMETFPDDFNDKTPRERFLEVMNYAQSSGMLDRYGRAPSTFVLAAQALRNPMGLAGIGRPQAGSVAAQTIADIRRSGEALAGAAAQGVAAATATQTPGGAVDPPKPKQQRVPRYVKDPRAPGGKRALTAKEVGEYLAKNPGAV